MDDDMILRKYSALVQSKSLYECEVFKETVYLDSLSCQQGAISYSVTAVIYLSDWEIM